MGGKISHVPPAPAAAIHMVGLVEWKQHAVTSLGPPRSREQHTPHCMMLNAHLSLSTSESLGSFCQAFTAVNVCQALGGQYSSLCFLCPFKGFERKGAPDLFPSEIYELWNWASKIGCDESVMMTNMMSSSSRTSHCDSQPMYAGNSPQARTGPAVL